MGLATRECVLGMVDCKMKSLTETDLEEIERMARENLGSRTAGRYSRSWRRCGD